MPIATPPPHSPDSPLPYIPPPLAPPPDAVGQAPPSPQLPEPQHPARQTAARRGRVRWIVAATVAGCLALGAGGYLLATRNDSAASAASTGATTSPTELPTTGAEYPDLYDYTEPMLDVEPDRVFEFPASYDILDKQQELCEDFFDSCLVQVFTDASLRNVTSATIETHRGSMSVRPRQWYVSNPSEDSTLDELTTRAPLDASVWGIHDRYYIVQRVSQDGTELERPLVTMFTVRHELETPEALYTVDQRGNVTASWEPVDGATTYLSIASCVSTIGRTRELSLLGSTTQTTWTAPPDPRGFGDQNAGLELYRYSDDTLSSMDRELESSVVGCEYGIIATDGAQYSPYLSQNADNIAPTAPNANAVEAQMGVFPEGRRADTSDALPLTYPYTTLDGHTIAGVPQARIDTVRGEETTWSDGRDRWTTLDYAWDLCATGTQVCTTFITTEGSELYLAIETDLAGYNARAAQAGPMTGMIDFAYASAEERRAAHEAEISREAPPTDYPIFATSELGAYLAANLIAGNTAIDVSAYLNDPSQPTLADAFDEVYFQNQYIAPINTHTSGLGTLFVYYASDDIDAMRSQQQWLKSRVDEIVAAIISPDMSDAAKVKAINNWITANTTYNYDAFAAMQSDDPIDHQYDNAWQAAGPLLEGTAVCVGYARAFSILAQAAGLEAVVVTGRVEAGGGHAWNKVKVEGVWLAVDTTWNDTDGGPGANQYLMINDSEFTGNATRSQNLRWIRDTLVDDYATP